MKIRLYMDVYPGIDERYLYASSQPSYPTSTGSTRYVIDIEIPDPYKPDAVAKTSVEEVTDNMVATEPQEKHELSQPSGPPKVVAPRPAITPRRR